MKLNNPRKRFYIKDLSDSYMEQGLFMHFYTACRELGIDIKRGGTKFIRFETMVELENMICRLIG